ncbi:response regulator transcription factor [Pusillimonas sp.]|uniref:response regulator transcription factor n=1 Tax=Pusillimonas sp. TaxID=3040095 RepID=UPI0029B02AC4|nr:response regulator transcription factor [Pusillimonas sp.]MDX3894732.1 response regulator transcription factor [Pusillimonas sp.]
MSSSFSLLIAVVEDSPELLADLVEFLNLQGFVAQGFESGEAFFRVWPSIPFNLLLLDVALPGVSGLEIARRIRVQSTGRRPPEIVMLTALDSSSDHVLGLEAGADTYLSKRSSLEVIEATCHSVRRRLERAALDDKTGGDAATEHPWVLHVRDWLMTAPNGRTLQLTHAEVVVLSMLFEHPGQAIAREALLLRLERRDTLSNLRNLDNTASRLRRKVLAACGMELPLRPSYGKGYTFGGRCGLAA